MNSVLEPFAFCIHSIFYPHFFVCMLFPYHNCITLLTYELYYKIVAERITNWKSFSPWFTTNRRLPLAILLYILVFLRFIWSQLFFPRSFLLAMRIKYRIPVDIVNLWTCCTWHDVNKYWNYVLHNFIRRTHTHTHTQLAKISYLEWASGKNWSSFI